MAYKVITRDDARAQGRKRYFDGLPCVRGHIAERQVINTCCMECQRQRARVAYALRDKEAERQRLREWTKANREKVNARSRAANATPERISYKADWYERNKEEHQRKMRIWRDARREELSAYSKAWAAANPDKVKEFHAANKDHAKELRKRWREENPDEYREMFRHENQRRRSLKKGASGSHTAAEADAILVSQNYCCKYCDADLRIVKPHLDHIIPLSRGGSNDKLNLQWLCESHNLQKSDKDPVEYERSIGFVR